MVHTAAPAVLNQPATHTCIVVEVVPAGQKKPGKHALLQLELVRPEALPKRPARHRPEQLAVFIAGSTPKRPTAQSVHTDEPDMLYRPMGHT